MSDIILFAGPSIAGMGHAMPATVQLRPPVQQGDVYLATQEQPAAIAIVDGFFDGVPAVWHKEILWALTRGIPVLGASSMGALRAAEMDRFGMVGIGQIYQAYRDGTLEDDDEVALLHGPAELGYPPLSLAMVNLRATLDAAQVAGVLSDAERTQVTERAKAQFYKIRTWETVLPEPGPLRQWIASNAVDQKQRDAQNLLDLLARRAFEAPQTGLHFEQTALWHQATADWRARAAATPRAGQRARLTSGASFRDQ